MARPAARRKESHPACVDLLSKLSLTLRCPGQRPGQPAARPGGQRAQGPALLCGLDRSLWGLLFSVWVMRLRMGGPSVSLSWDCSGPLPGFRAQGSPGWAGQLLRSHGCPLGAQGRAQHRGLCSQVSKNREPTLLSSSTASLSGVSSGAVWSEKQRHTYGAGQNMGRGWHRRAGPCLCSCRNSRPGREHG